MKSRKWLIVLLAIVTVMALATYTGATRSYFVDDEQSTDDALGIRWGLFTLNDGFENTGSPPWDDYWNENGTTSWLQSSSKPHAGTYAARLANTDTPGYLTSDEIEASTADNITVSFWFYPKALETGDILLQTYNGTVYNTWYDLLNYATYTNNAWCLFDEVITDSQYLIAGFRLRFDASALGDSSEEINIDDIVITTDTTPPAAPTGLVATSGNEEISLTWNSNNETDLWGYNVYRSLTSSANYTQANGSVVLTSAYTDTVYGGGTYYYVVTALDFGNNESGYSLEDSATASNLAPAAPTGLVATAGNEEITLDWNDNIETDLSGYNVYRSLTSSANYTQINGLVTTSNFTDTGLYGGGTYYYVVKAVDNASAESGYSNEDSATANDIAPPAPTGLVATAGDEEISLDWNDNIETDMDGYNIYRGTVSGNYTVQIGSLVATSNYTDTELYGGGTYYYVVTAVDLGSNESGYSNEDSATAIDVAPATPNGLVATGGNEEISLNWNDNTESDMNGYNVYRSLTSSANYTQINGSLVTTSNYTNTPLYGGGTYYYVVTAIDLGTNESGYSNEDSATANNTAPAAPTGLVATAGNEEITLDWNDNVEADLDGYNIYRGTVSGNYTVQIGSLVSTSNFTDTPLYGGGTYYYVVTAVDLSTNKSGYSNEDSVTANDVAPAAPTGLVATPGGEQVSLDWSDNTESDLDGYNIYRHTSSGGPYSQINGSLVTTSNYTDTGLSAGIPYYYVVTAVDLGSNESGYSTEDNATPTNAPPAAPTGLVATPGDRQVSLDWDDNSEGDLDGYNVYRSLTSSANYTQINGSLVATSNYNDGTVHGGTTYYYVVTAVDTGVLESGYSNEDSATPLSPISIDDGFEGDPWDVNWDENGTTSWIQEGTPSHSGSSSTHADNAYSGYLTSDDVDASASTNTTVRFWFYPKSLEAGDLLVQTYNGTAYNTWYDLINYPTYTNSAWCEFNEILSDSQYFIAGFRLRFDASALLDGNDNINIDDVMIITDSIPPAAPTNLGASPGNTEVGLDWDDNSEGDLDGYNVYRHTSSGGPYSQINGGLVTTSNYTDTGRTNGVTYYYVVTAVDLGSNESGYSNEDSATPVDPPPAAPTNLVASPGDAEVGLNWDDNSEGDLDGYNVYRSLTSSANYTQVNGSLVATSNYTDTGRTNGVTYYYVVTAVDLGTNESGYSNEDSATPVDVAPAAPTGLVATAGNEEITLDWNDNVEADLDGYNIYRGTVSGNYTVQIGSLVSTSNFTDTPLYGGGTYYYVVTAVDLSTNKSGYSNEDSVTANDVAPAAPTGLVATPGGEQVSLDWSDNTESDLDGYNIYRHTSSGGPYIQINGSLVTTSNYTDTGLSAGIPYYYVVTAVDLGSNESGYSTEDNATPTNAPPAAPTGLVATPGDRQVSLDWDDNSEGDLDGYNVYRSLTSSTNYTQINGSLVATSNYNDGTVHGGTTYYYVVTAVDTGVLESGYSNEDSATPLSPTSIDDGFEGTPWDVNWDENGTTSWIQEGTPSHSGSSSTHADNAYSGYLTSDDVDASASTNTTVRFWFYPKSLEAGDLLVQTYNGTAYNTWYDLINYPTYTNSAWCEFNEILSDSQYLITGFRLRFDASALLDGNDNINIDDVMIITDSIPPAAPTNLGASPGNTEVYLDWDDNLEGDLDGYNVYRHTSSGGPYSQINGGLVTTSNYTDTGRTNGVTYFYVVTAVDLGSNESGYSNEASATPVDAPPAAPTNLVATPGNTEVDLDWDDNLEGDLDGYNVYRSLTSSENYTQVNGSLVTTSNYTDTGRTNGVTYYYVVTAVDLGTNESGYSNEASTTPVDAPPAAPTNLVATPGNTEVDLNWDDNSEGDLDGYNVYRSLTSSENYTQVNGSLVATSNYTDTGRTNGVTYYYVVTAVDLGTNESGYSNEASTTPVDAPPAAPTNLVATPGNTEVDLNWDDNSEGDLDGYNVYRSLTSSENYTQVNGSLVATSNYTDTGRTNGVTYYYVVTAVDLCTNESGYSNEASATPVDVAPAAPTNLVATPGNTEVDLDWDDNSEGDLDGYNVYRSLISSANYTQVNGSLVATSNYTDTGRTNGVTYYYVVTEVDTGALESGYSNEASATPFNPPITLIDDGFEGTPWDANWDGNGTTDWQTGAGYGGSTYSAHHASGDTYLTSDDLDASAADNITVSFWFKIKDLTKGTLYVQTYDGTAYNNWFDLTTYPGVVKNTWTYFSETITDSQYSISNFRIRFDGSGLTTDGFIDDVLIITNQ